MPGGYCALRRFMIGERLQPLVANLYKPDRDSEEDGSRLKIGSAHLPHTTRPLHVGRIIRYRFHPAQTDAGGGARSWVFAEAAALHVVLRLDCTVGEIGTRASVRVQVPKQTLAQST